MTIRDDVKEAHDLLVHLAHGGRLDSLAPAAYAQMTALVERLGAHAALPLGLVGLSPDEIPVRISSGYGVEDRIGIDAKCSHVSSGYDQTETCEATDLLPEEWSRFPDDGKEHKDFARVTPQDRQEVAEIMIARWVAWSRRK